jgi:hypothetical protein
VEVETFRSIGEHPYTVTTIECSDCCNFQLSIYRGRQNMGFLKKIKFWKKKNNNTPTKVDACVSTEDPLTCDAATMSMDPTVICANYTQTEIRMDGVGGAAATQEYEHELEVKNQKIRKLEEELAVSKRLTADFMLNMNRAKQQLRKYAEQPVIMWSDDCECKQQVSAVADLLKKFITMERNTNPSQDTHLAGTPKLTANPDKSK